MTSIKTETLTANTAEVYYFDENGQREFPCRCGQTHRGDYAANDYAHHNCFHRSHLFPIEAEIGYYMCGDCGEVFWLHHPVNICPECEGHWRKKSGDEPTATYECGNGHTWEGPARPFRVEGDES